VFVEQLFKSSSGDGAACNISAICLVFIERLCKSPSQQSSGDGTFRHTKNWKPLVLIVPLRLGLNEINPVYVQGLKVRTTLTAVCK
jgi:hypothetical protein